MSSFNSDSQIQFLANKVYVHRWPMNSPTWSTDFQEKIDLDLNKNIDEKKIIIFKKAVKINDYEFLKIKKIGITVPLFKKETTMVFEGHFSDLDAHIHITTQSKEYLKIFNTLMEWKGVYFDDVLEQS